MNYYESNSRRKGVDKMMVHAISEYEASIARIIFLCIKNLEFELGANKLAQILTGTQTKFITDYELQNNPAFALLKQYSQGDIKKIIDILEMCEYLDYEEVRKNMSVLVLTKKAKDFLNGNCEFDTSFIDAITETDFVQLDDQQNELYEKLRELRYSIAKTLDMPAYIVCYDKALRNMAFRQPTNDEELLEIKGIGPVFIEKYGKQFLTEIKDFQSDC